MLRRLTLGLVALGLAGCGVSSFPDALVGSDGEFIRLSQVAEINQNQDLTPEERRQALMDLGIEDPDLLDLLLGDFQPG